MAQRDLDQNEQAITVDELSPLPDGLSINNVLFYTFVVGPQQTPHRKATARQLKQLLGIFAENYILGDGIKTVFDLSHNFGTRWVNAVVVESATGLTPTHTVIRTNDNMTRIVFSQPPASDSVVVHLSVIRDL